MWWVVLIAIDSFGDLLFPTTLKGIMDYKKLGRLFSKYEASKIDTLINVDINLISEYDKIFVKYGFIKVDGQKFLNNMSGRENQVFQLTKSVALDEINFLVRSISKILRDDFDLKEIDLLRDQLQIQQLEHDKISKEHQKLNGELRVEAKEEKERRQFAEGELSIVKGIGNNSPEMKKLIAELKEVKADNKKLAETVERLTHTPNRLRDKGLI